MEKVKDLFNQYFDNSQEFLFIALVAIGIVFCWWLMANRK